MKAKTSIIIFLFSILALTVQGQKNTFIAGAVLNFNGIHTQGDAISLYSPENGTL